MKKRFTILIAALAAILMMTLPEKVVGQAKPDPTYEYVLVEDYSSLSTSDTYVIAGNIKGGDTWYSLKNNQVTTAGYLPIGNTLTISNKKITSTITSDETWMLESVTNQTDQFYIKSTKGSYYLQNAGAVKSTITTKSQTDNNNKWKIHYKDTNSNTNKSATGLYNVGVSRELACYSSSNWRCYTQSDYGNIDGAEVVLYKRQVVSSDPSISVSPTAPSTVPCSGGSVEFSITPTNIASPSYSLQFYTAASGGSTTTKPDWINTPSFEGNTLTLTVAANNGAARTAYFSVKSGDTESTSRVTLNQALYTVTPPTLTASANFDANIDVTITPASGNATVYYTTDNSTPSNTNGTAITSATVINLKATTTVKAIGYDANSVASTVTSATYTKSTKNISEITTTGSYSVVGTVVATHSKGFVIGDGTGYVYYYYNSYSSGSVAINNNIKFSSKSISAYAHVLEFNNQSYSNNQASSNYEALPVTTLNASGIASYMSGNHLSDYVQIEGTASVSTTDNTYDINVSGATYNVRLAYPTDDQKSALSALHNHKVRVKGYFTGFNNNTDANATHFTIMLESVEDINPVVAASGDLNEFTYAYGSGPSAAQSINVSGSLLTANITVTASSNYEVCLTSNGEYTSSVTLTQSAGSVASTPVYIRLKSGLNSGTYSTNSDKITVSSTGATDVTVALSGSVTHAIAYGTPDHCTTLSGNTAAAYGTSVTITAEPASGYKLGSWNITKTSDGNSAGITPEIVSGNDYTITMPDFDITVNATFVPAYTITVTNSTPLGGSVYTTPTSAGEGEEITITIEPNSGYDLNTLVVKDSELNEIEVTNNKFEMPASNVTITVSFIATYTVTYDKNGASVTGTAPVDASSPYHSGATVTVLGKGDLAWEGHSFSKWNTGANGQGTPYEVGATFDILANTTLYAQWTTNTYAYSLTLTGQDESATAVLKVGGSAIAAEDVIEYGTEVTVAVTVSNASNYAYAIKVKNNTTGDYLTVTNDKFTMPASAVTVTVVTDLMTTLTSTNMNNVSNCGTTYGTGSDNIKTITVNGFYWEANAYQNGKNCGYLQINTNGSNTASGSYIKLPIFPGKIEKITLTVNNTSRSLYFNTTNSTSNTIVTASNGNSNSTKIIDMSGVCYQTGYIVCSGGAVQISNIVVTYRPYQDMAGSTITTIEPDVTVSIPEDASVSATNLTIPVSSGLYIKSGATLSVNGTITNSGNANNLVIEDGGQLILSNDKSVAATVKKTVNKPTGTWGNDDASGWYAISSPVGNIAPGSVTNMVLPAVSTVPQYDLYKYVEDMGWYNAQATNQSIATLEKGHGYLYARSANASLSYAGIVTSASFDIENLSKSDVKHPGLHLIGNPYTHDIYLGTAITGTNLTTTGYYALNSDGLWISKAYTEPIKPMQAVFVFVTNTTNTINFSNKPSATRAHHDYIRFTVANSQYEDVAYAMFDKGYGLNKIEHRNSEAPMIYIPQDDDNYAIAMMEDVTKMFNLSFKAATTGRYTLSFDTQGEYNYLHVIDRLTGEDVDMLLEGEYSFIGSPNDNENRFVVKLAYKPDYSEGNNEIFAFQSGSDILISGEGELQVFDVMGRFVMSERINGATSISADELSKGVYVLRIVGTEIKTQKIIIK